VLEDNFRCVVPTPGPQCRTNTIVFKPFPVRTRYDADYLNIWQHADSALVRISPETVLLKEFSNHILQKFGSDSDGGYTLAAVVFAMVEQNCQGARSGKVEKSMFVKEGSSFLADLLAGVEEAGLRVFE
ncbi:uncharacterized protein J4E92_008315, partial [Alternaria infectoria]|uniref:uncharacterized protein n=1 Tax=Alternaria infectoria TaxID=45303 RepID=UPI002220BB7B